LTRPCLPPDEPAARSRGVLSPSAFSVPEARFPRVCLTRHLPSSGFLTLLTTCFLRNPPAMFQAGNALGVFPSGLLPLAKPSNPFGPDPLRGVGIEVIAAVKQLFPPRLTFKAFLSARIRHLRNWVEPPAVGRCPPGLSPSREFLPAAAPGLRQGSPLELHLCHNIQDRASQIRGADVPSRFSQRPDRLVS